VRPGPPANPDNGEFNAVNHATNGEHFNGPVSNISCSSVCGDGIQFDVIDKKTGCTYHVNLVDGPDKIQIEKTSNGSVITCPALNTGCVAPDRGNIVKHQ